MLTGSKTKKMDINIIIIVIITGIFSGILSGMVGVGGGIIIVPALIYFLGFSQFQAQGTSLALLLLPVGILGVIQYHKQGYIDYKIVLLLALGFIAGNYLGSKFSLSLPQHTVKKVFAVILLLLALKMLFLDKAKKDKSTTTSVNQESLIK